MMAKRGFAWIVILGLALYLIPAAVNWILGWGKKSGPADGPGDSIGTKLRRFRDCRTVRCGREDCQAWNPERARYCRHCGTTLR